MMAFFLVFCVAVVAVFVSKYNMLQKLAHQVRRVNGDILASLQKRADLANRLMDIAKEYGLHEKLTHITVSDNLRQALQVTNEAVIRINAISNNFPQLLANESYNMLMKQLEQMESGIQITREQYNMAASNYNTYRSQIPQSFFASSLGFSEAPYFNTENLDSLNDFKTDDGEMLRKALSGAVDKTVGTVKKGMEDLSGVINKKPECGAAEANADPSALSGGEADDR
jgi:LemA protein